MLITSIQNSPTNYISPSGEIRLRIYSAGGTKNYTASGDWIQFTVETNITLNNTVSPFSILEEKKQTEFIVYPNPVSDILQISSPSAIRNFKITNIQGAVLQQGKPIENAIDVSNLSSGLYFLQMKLENGEEQIQRVIKK